MRDRRFRTVKRRRGPGVRSPSGWKRWKSAPGGTRLDPGAGDLVGKHPAFHIAAQHSDPVRRSERPQLYNLPRSSPQDGSQVRLIEPVLLAPARMEEIKSGEVLKPFGVHGQPGGAGLVRQQDLRTPLGRHAGKVLPGRPEVRRPALGIGRQEPEWSGS